MIIRLIFSVVYIYMISNSSILASSSQEGKSWFNKCSESLVDVTKRAYSGIASIGNCVTRSFCRLSGSSKKEMANTGESVADSSLYVHVSAMLQDQFLSMQKEMAVCIGALFEQQAEILQAQYDQYLEKQQKLYAHLYDKQESLKQIVEHKIDGGLRAFNESMADLSDAAVMIEVDEKKLAKAGSVDLESTLKKHVDNRIRSLAKYYKNIDKKLSVIASAASSPVTSDASVDIHTLEYINRRVCAALQKKMGRNT